MLAFASNLLANSPFASGNQHSVPVHRPQTPPTIVSSSVDATPTVDAAPLPPTTEPGPIEEKRKREKKTEVLSETFIFVRPPPATTNHPLNLQVQLVPPAFARSSDRRVSNGSDSQNQSTDTVHSLVQSPSSSGYPLARSESRQSNRSVTSFYSSASQSSISASSTASMGRRIVPLYNLSAHNIMTNTVTDAGTDAKIAKLTKKGIEMVGLGFMECIQVHRVPPNSPLLLSPESCTNKRASFLLAEEPRSPNSRSLSPPKPPSLTFSSTSSISINETSTRGPSARKIFGKLFKRQSESNQDSLSPTPTSSPSFFKRGGAGDKSSTPGSPSKRLSFFNSPTTTPTRQETFSSQTASNEPPQPKLVVTDTISTSEQTTASQSAACLGVMVSIVYRAAPPSRFPTSASVELDPDNAALASTSSGNPRPIRSYEWVVRKWIKGTDGSILGLVKNNAESLLSATESVFSGLEPSSRNSTAFGAPAYVEVKFEWTRGKGAKARAREKQLKRERAATLLAQSEATSDGAVTASTVVVPPTPTLPQESSPSDSGIANEVSQVDLRPSMESKRSSSPGNTSNPGNRHSPPMSPGSSSGGQPQKSSSRRSSRRRNSSIFVSGGADEGDEDSDPEDSETPWTCTVWMSRVGDVGPSNGRVSLSSDAGTSSHHCNPVDADTIPFSPTAASPKVKVKVAAMTPAPHHPKVVSQLKMPYPLPDLDVDRCEVVPNRGDRDQDGGLVLTAEEIKDVVCVTGLWLAVKEGFGGLDTRRKGDGWKIRG